MSAPQPLSAAVRAEVLTVCRTAFYYRDDLKSLMLTAGVPAAVYNRYDHPEIAKVKIARSVLDELHELGSAGWAVQRKIVVQLCGMTRPANGVEDIAAGKAALVALKQVVSHEGIIVDAEQAAIHERRAREGKRQKQIGEQRQEMQRLNSRFATLSAQQPRTISERQTRGYELESLLADLFRANDLDYTGSTRQPREQVDGSFHFRGFTYLVEARWRSQPPTTGDLADFKVKVDGKLESTRGLFISMIGFNEEILQHFANVSGKRNVVYMTGQDLALIFEGCISLVDALIKKIDAAEKQGRYLIDLSHSARWSGPAAAARRAHRSGRPAPHRWRAEHPCAGDHRHDAHRQPRQDAGDYRGQQMRERGQQTRKHASPPGVESDETTVAVPTATRLAPALSPVS